MTADPKRPSLLLAQGASLLAALVFLVAMSLHDLCSNDVWIHVAAGRQIVETGRVPRTDPFGYGAGQGRPWLDHEWLAQVAFYAAHQAGGVRGLLVLQAGLVVLAALAGVVAVARRSGLGWAAVVPIPLGLMAYTRFMVRPELFAFLSAGGMLLCLCSFERCRGRGCRVAWLAALALLQWVWANAHPSFPVGVGMAVAFAFGAWFKRPVAPVPGRPWCDAAWLALAAAICAAATLLTPQGPALWLHPFRQVGASAFMQGVGEWKALWSGDVGGAWRVTFMAVVGVGLLAFVANMQATDWPQALVFVGAALLPCASARHVGIAAFLLAPIVVGQVARAQAEFMWRPKPRLAVAASLAAAALSVALTVFAAHNAFYAPQRSPRRFGFGMDALQYPAKAVDFVEGAGLRGPMFNNYDIGGYLMWRLGPKRQVFIDGRNMVYGEECYVRYREALLDLGKWERLLQEHGIEWVILRHLSVDMGGPLRWLWQDRRWALCYYDEVAAVFVRRDGINADVVRLHEQHLEDLAPEGRARPSLDALLSGAAEPGADPRVDAAWAGLCRKLGLFGRAVRRLEQAVGNGYGTPTVLNDLGGLYFKLGRRAEAERLLRLALEKDPGLVSAQRTLGTLYALTGRHREAIEYLRMALGRTPNDPRLHNDLANSFVRAGDMPSAMKHYRRALELKPDYRLPAYNLASILISQQRYEEARAVCRELLSRDPNDAAAKSLLGRIPK